MLWIILSLLASFLWSIVNTIDKFVLTKWIREPIAPVIIVQTSGLLASLIVYLFFGLPPLSTINLIIAIIAGVCYTLMSIFYFKALKLEEVSRVIPLFFLSPLFILILAFLFLGEALTPFKYIGVFLLVLGAIFLSLKKFKISFGKAFWLMILSTLSISINAVLSKYLLDFADFWTVFSWTRIGAFIAAVPLFYFYFSELKNAVKRHGKRVIGVMAINDSINFTAVLLITLATSIGFVTLVNALSSLQPFFVLILALILSIFYPKILKEEVNKTAILTKFLAIALMFAGTLLIV